MECFLANADVLATTDIRPKKQTNLPLGLRFNLLIILHINRHRRQKAYYTATLDLRNQS